MTVPAGTALQRACERAIADRPENRANDAKLHAPTTEVRVTDPDTGGQKGQKLARWDLLPWEVLNELAEHYGKGEKKYPSPDPTAMNWQLGYDWRLSFAALQRHLVAWWGGEDTDAETGSSHLTAVIWHAAALRWFQLHDKGKDTRP